MFPFRTSDSDSWSEARLQNQIKRRPPVKIFQQLNPILSEVLIGREDIFVR